MSNQDCKLLTVLKITILSHWIIRNIITNFINCITFSNYMFVKP